LLFYDAAKEKGLFNMRKRFSELFVVDKDSPKYTACMAIILFHALGEPFGYKLKSPYDQLLRSYEPLIDTIKVSPKKCFWWRSDNDGYDVPEGYPSEDNPPCIQCHDGSNHCLHLIYRYTEYYPDEPHPLKKLFIQKLCIFAECTDKLSPNEIQGIMIVKFNEYVKNFNPSQKSVAV
jgi:hypothetical protein